MVPYGGWGEWIKKETDFSQATATRFMKIFDEYGADQISIFGAVAESSTLQKVSISNALRLLAVPEEEREEFAREVDAEHISARELEQAIKERDEAIKKAAEASERAEKAEAYMDKADKNVDRYMAETMKAQKETEELREKVKELESRPVEVAVQAPDPAEIEKAVSKALKDEKAAAKERERKLKADAEQQKAAQAELRKQLEDAEKQLKQAQEAARSAEDSGQALQEAQAEAEKLRKQLAMSGEQLTVFKLRFAAWQGAYHEMRKALEAVPEEAKANCEAAVKAVIAGWTA
jgi:DNA repair exonuclease SbcCD ATPase subunit